MFPADYAKCVLPAYILPQMGYQRVWSTEELIPQGIFLTFWWKPGDGRFFICFHEMTACHTNTEGECVLNSPTQGIAIRCYSTDVPEEAFLNTIFSHDVHAN